MLEKVIFDPNQSEETLTKNKERLNLIKEQLTKNEELLTQHVQ